jgi:hypothetical protein
MLAKGFNLLCYLSFGIFTIFRQDRVVAKLRCSFCTTGISVKKHLPNVLKVPGLTFSTTKGGENMLDVLLFSGFCQSFPWRC